MEWSGVEWYAYANGCGTRVDDDNQRVQVLAEVEQAFSILSLFMAHHW